MLSTEHEMKVWGSNDVRVRLGTNHHPGTTEVYKSVMYVYRDKSGSFGRGTQKEFPATALIQMTVFALMHGWITREDIRAALVEMMSGQDAI